MRVSAFAFGMYGMVWYDMICMVLEIELVMTDSVMRLFFVVRNYEHVVAPIKQKKEGIKQYI